MDDSVSLPARLAESYKRLAASAEVLRGKSDLVHRSVTTLNLALAKLDLGIPAWVKIRGNDDDGDGNFWHEWVGYAPVGQEWGLALSETKGNHRSPDQTDDVEWAFHKAPRSLQISALDKLPDLMEELIKVTDKTSKKLDSKLDEVREYAKAITTASSEVTKARKERRS